MRGSSGGGLGKGNRVGGRRISYEAIKDAGPQLIKVLGKDDVPGRQLEVSMLTSATSKGLMLFRKCPDISFWQCFHNNPI